MHRVEIEYCLSINRQYSSRKYNAKTFQGKQARTLYEFMKPNQVQHQWPHYRTSDEHCARYPKDITRNKRLHNAPCL